MTVRAKFYCATVEHTNTGPTPVQRYNQDTRKTEPSDEMQWPRTYRFTAQYDQSIPEDVRYAKASPSGELRIQVDNPAVSFTPGRSYYLDFTEVPAEPA